MDLKYLVTKNFLPISLDSINIIEKYDSFELNYQLAKGVDFSGNKIEAIRNFLFKSDLGIIKIIIGNDDPITYNFSNSDTAVFIQTVNDSLLQVNSEDHIKLILQIQKGTENGITSIYQFQAFNTFIESLDLYTFLEIVSDNLKKFEQLEFVILDDSFESFYSNSFIFRSAIQLTPSRSPFPKVYQIHEYCHFGNFATFPFNFATFKLLKRPTTSNNIEQKLDLLTNLFNIISIYDITHFDSACLYYKLNGYKVFDGKITLDNNLLTSKNVYDKIIEWIYVESSKISDKIGIARNILSIFLKNESLEIDDQVFYSIQSGYKTYLKENLNRYIEVRNKITDQLMTLTKKSTDLFDQYLNNYQKSNYSILTFFVSVFIIRVLTQSNFESVFTKDVTIISFGLIVISIIFLLFSLWNLNTAIKRLNDKYEQLKQRFEDLLIKEDIKKILRNDKEFNDDMLYLKLRRNQITALWISTIIIFISIVLSLSTYFNWSIIHQWFCNLFK